MASKLRWPVDWAFEPFRHTPSPRFSIQAAARQGVASIQPNVAAVNQPAPSQSVRTSHPAGTQSVISIQTVDLAANTRAGFGTLYPFDVLTLGGGGSTDLPPARSREVSGAPELRSGDLPRFPAHRRIVGAPRPGHTPLLSLL